MRHAPYGGNLYGDDSFVDKPRFPPYNKQRKAYPYWSMPRTIEEIVIVSGSMV